MGNYDGEKENIRQITTTVPARRRIPPAKRHHLREAATLENTENAFSKRSACLNGRRATICVENIEAESEACGSGARAENGGSRRESVFGRVWRAAEGGGGGGACAGRGCGREHGGERQA